MYQVIFYLKRDLPPVTILYMAGVGSGGAGVQR